MSDISDKKKRERFFLDRFLESIGLQPDGIEEREGPDFVLTLEKKRIGIEVTHLHIREISSDPLPQALESITQRIVSEAERHYKSLGGTPALVTVLFNSALRTDGLHRSSVARDLAQLVNDVDLPQGSALDWQSWDENKWDHPISKVIHSLHIWAVPDNDLARWRIARAGWVAPMTAERLQEAISCKCQKIHAYKAIVPEVWLLMVSDGTKPSQAFQSARGLNVSAAGGGFSRAFYYKYPDQELVEIDLI